MIEIVDGVGVGSGKSFYVMTRCLSHFLRGGTVYSSENFVLLWEPIKKFALERYGLVLEERQYRQVPSDEMLRLHENTPPGTDECPVLIIVDEAQDFFDVRDHADRTKRAFFSWCTQSRHDNNDLIFITQDANNIDARFRRLATYRITVRNTVNWKIVGMGSFASIIQLATLGLNNGRYFVAFVYDRDGRTLFERNWIRQSSAYFALYVSKSMNQKHKRAGLPVEKLKLQKVKSRNPMIKYFIFGGFIAVIASVVYLGTRFKEGTAFGSKPKAQQVATVSNPDRSAAQKGGELSQPQPKPAYEVINEEFRGISRIGETIILRTSAGQYVVNVMSAHGFCVGIDFDGRVAKLRRADGLDLFVVAQDRPGVGAHVAASAVASKEPAVLAETPSPTSKAPPWLDYGQRITTGFGTMDDLDFAQQRIQTRLK